MTPDLTTATGREWVEIARIRVYGIPVGQPRARARAVRVGTAVTARMYDPGTADGWKRDIQQACLPFRKSTPLLCNLKVDSVAYFPRPKSHYGTGRNSGKLKVTAPTHNDGKPDRDNLDKAILDAMTGIGFMRDDKQVVKGEAPEKLYVCEECEWKPGALIVVSVKSSDMTGVPQ